MNPINLISSTLALGAMIGITGSHYREVQVMVENASQASLVGGDSSIATNAVFAVNASPKTTTLMNGNSSQANASASVESPASRTKVAKASSVRVKGGLDTRDSALMEILIAIREEQKNLRIQLGDTNRNVDELAFRVDTYSTEFRPLQTEIGTPRARVVPEEEFAAPFSGQLLPPKQ